MILTCPACSARYVVDPQKIGAAGRDVRCARCSNQWFFTPAAEDLAAMTPSAPPQAAPRPAAQPSPQPAPEDAAVEGEDVAEEGAPKDSFSDFLEKEGAAVADEIAAVTGKKKEQPAETSEASAGDEFADQGGNEGEDDAAEDIMAHEREDISADGVDDLVADRDHAYEGDAQEEGAKRKKRLPPGLKNLPAFPPLKYYRPTPGWLGFFVALTVVCGSIYFAREDLVAAWTPTARLYDMLGVPVEVAGSGLRFEQVTMKYEQDGATPLLIIEGEIVNRSLAAKEVPLMVARLLDERNQEIHRWTFRSSKDQLVLAESSPFKTQFAMKDNLQDAAKAEVSFLVE